MKNIITLAVASALTLSGCHAVPASAETIVNAPAAKRVAKEGSGLKVAIFAGGCFWGVEGVFSQPCRSGSCGL